MITNEAVFTEDRKRTIRKSQEHYKTANKQSYFFWYYREHDDIFSEVSRRGPISGLHQVSTKAREEYAEQSDNLPVIFECTDGRMRCNERFLVMSDFYNEQIKARRNFHPEKPVVFDHSNKSASSQSAVDKPFPKKVIKHFLDCIHQQRAGRLSLLDKMLFISFLMTEGREDSPMEKHMAEAMLANLKEQLYDRGTTLTILVYLQSLNTDWIFSSYLHNAGDVLAITDKATMAITIHDFDPMSKPEVAELCVHMTDAGIIADVSAQPEDNLEIAVIQLAKKLVKISEEPVVKPKKRRIRLAQWDSDYNSLRHKQTHIYSLSVL